MMLHALTHWQAPALAVVAWLATFVIHSTVLLAIAYLVQRRFAARPEIVDIVWKTAIVGALVSASVQTALAVDPAGGRLSVAAAPEAGELTTDATPPVVRPAGALAPARSAEMATPEGVVRTTAPTPARRDDDRDEEIGITARMQPSTLPPAPRDRDDASTTAARATVVGQLRAAEPASLAVAPRSPPTSAWAWLAAAWLVVATAGLLGLARAWWRLRHALRTCVPAPASMMQLLAELQRGETPVRLSLCPRIAVPIATGVFAPHIVVPPRVLQLSSDAQRTVLAHELAHVRRRDPAWRLVLALLERVLFVQPLLRAARAGIEHSAEYLCDRWAAARTEAPIELARCLTEIATWTPAVRIGLAATLPEPQSILGRRVVRLLEPAAVAAPRVHLRSLAAMSAAGAALVVLAPTVSSARDPAPAPAPMFGEAPPLVFVRAQLPDAAPEPMVVAAFAASDEAEAEAEGEGTPSTAKQRRSTRRRLRRAIAQARHEHRDVELDELARALDAARADGESLVIVLDDGGLRMRVDAEAIEAMRRAHAELAALDARAARAERSERIEAAHAQAAHARARAASQRRRAFEDVARARAHAEAARHEARRRRDAPTPPPAPAAPRGPGAPPAPPAPPAWIEVDAAEGPTWFELEAPQAPAWIEMQVPDFEIDAPEAPAWIEMQVPDFEIDAPEPPAWIEIDAPDAPTWLEVAAPEPPACPDAPEAPAPPSAPTWTRAPLAPIAPAAPAPRAAPVRRVAQR